MCYCTDIDENLERHGGDKAHAVPIHMKADRLDIKSKVAAQKAEAEAASGGAKGPASVSA